jgi:hypothetical protein
LKFIVSDLLQATNRALCRLGNRIPSARNRC